MQSVRPVKLRNESFTAEFKSGKMPVTKLFSNMVEKRPQRSKPSFLVSQYQLASLFRDVAAESNDGMVTVRTTADEEMTASIIAACAVYSSAKGPSVSENLAKIEIRSGSHPLPSINIDPSTRNHIMNAVSLASDSTDNIGCNRPISLINARAHERTRRQTQASFTREQGEASHLEAITKSIQDKILREARDIVFRENYTRRKFWMKVLALSFAQMHLTIKLPQQLKDENNLQMRIRAATAIQSVYRNHKLRRFGKLFVRVNLTHPWFKHSFTLAIKLWRKRRAALRIKDFLVSCSACNTHGFSANYVRRFMRSVKFIQRLVRNNIVCRNARILALCKIWDAYESQYVGDIVRKIQKRPKSDLQRTKSTPTTSSASDVKPKDKEKDKKRGSKSVDNTSSLPILFPEIYQSRKEMTQKQHWLAINKKLNAFDEKTAWRKPDIVSTYLLPREIKIPLLKKILLDARRSVLVRYTDSLLLQQKAVERNNPFSLEDAATLMSVENDDSLISMVRYKMQLVDTLSRTSDKKLKLPFMLYRINIDPNLVYKSVREAHRKNMTVDDIGKFHSRLGEH